ncbi:MAG: FHA domain-containing protein [bacterium]
MSGPTELLILRLGLIALMFGFLAMVALTLRGGLARGVARRPSETRGAWRFVVISPGESGLRRGAEFALAGTMLIGRDARAGIVIPDGSVSTRHASIERVAGGWRVIDLGSTNGTLVNGRQIPPDGAVLRGDEKVSFGSVVVQLSSG